MSIGFEIVLAIALGVAVPGFALVVTLLAFVAYPWFERRQLAKQYPLVTKQGMRVKSIPVSGITLDDISQAIEMFIKRAVEVGPYKEKALRVEVKRSLLEFVRAVNDEGGRWIIDKYGRKIAGDNNMKLLRVVVLDVDYIHSVALFHELGHLADETIKVVDYGHTNDKLWKEVVAWCKKTWKEQT